MPKPLTEYLWIVDGHNLVLNVPELTRLYNHESKKAARDAAEKRLAALADASPNAVNLVFDGDSFPGGQPGAGERGKLLVRFVDPPAEADDWIVQLARQEADAGHMVAVATSDRGLLARLAGGKPIHRMAVDAFWRESGRVARQNEAPAPVEKPVGSSPEEMAVLEKAMSRPLPEERPRRPQTPPARRPDAAKPAAAGAKHSGAPGRPGASAERQTESVPPAPPAPPSPPSKPPPPPPPPPRDWRAEVTDKKERGRQRQLKRLARRKGS
jgi:predicted RNA-binding protein with PIN domain